MSTYQTHAAPFLGAAITIALMRVFLCKLTGFRHCASSDSKLRVAVDGNSIQKSIFVLLAAVLACILSVGRAGASPPNVLVIVADDMGYSDVGSYGGEIETPNLDALASNGLRFTNFYNTARCWPSRASLLTGFYAQHIGRDSLNGDPLLYARERPPWAPLLPAMLKAAGYRSYHSGKWHIDDTPAAGGFDRAYDIDGGGGHLTEHKVTATVPSRAKRPTNGPYYDTIAVADHAIEDLQDHAAQYPEKPFFQYVAFTVPHLPLQALPEDIEGYRGRYAAGWGVLRQKRWEKLIDMGITEEPASEMERGVGSPYVEPEDVRKWGPFEVNQPVPWHLLSVEQRRFQAQKMEIHAAMVDRMDREIGRILQQLRTMDAWQNTLIFFLSDNGASAEMMMLGKVHDRHAAPGSVDTYLTLGPGWSSASNAPFRRHKIWVHEGGISTPLIVHWPGKVPKGELRSTPGHLVDLTPTIMEAAGIPMPKEWQGVSVPSSPGRSLFPAFAKEGVVLHEYLWWMHEGNRALRMGNWKIVSAPDRSNWPFYEVVRDKAESARLLREALKAPWQLYDLSYDRAELHDLAAEFPERVRSMAQHWENEYENAKRLAQ